MPSGTWMRVQLFYLLASRTTPRVNGVSVIAIRSLPAEGTYSTLSHCYSNNALPFAYRVEHRLELLAHLGVIRLLGHVLVLCRILPQVE